MTYKQACCKHKVELFLIYPLVLIGKLIGILYPLKIKSSIFLFFPSDSIGGATKVNADILNLLIPHHPTVVFSKKYNNNIFENKFTLPNVNIIDLRSKVDNK